MQELLLRAARCTFVLSHLFACVHFARSTVAANPGAAQPPTHGNFIHNIYVNIILGCSFFFFRFAICEAGEQQLRPETCRHHHIKITQSHTVFACVLLNPFGAGAKRTIIIYTPRIWLCVCDTNIVLKTSTYTPVNVRITCCQARRVTRKPGRQGERGV